MLKKILCLTGVLLSISACAALNPPSACNGMMDARGAPSMACSGINDRVFFDVNKAELSETSRSTLDHQAQWLKQSPGLKILIQGYADEQGDMKQNVSLGQRRAMAVKNYLISAGVSAARIRTVSYGENYPQEAGHDQNAWASNRLAVTVVE